MIVVTRYHDFCAGHRVAGHEGKCSHLHGHGYRIHFTVRAKDGALDSVGRVLDFSFIKSALCDWLEEHWDHKFLLWDQDPLLPLFTTLAPGLGLMAVPFNPTAEHMADYLLRTVGPAQLPQDCILTQVKVDETRKCSATAAL